jgi:hypothetical protein
VFTSGRIEGDRGEGVVWDVKEGGGKLEGGCKEMGNGEGARP